VLTQKEADIRAGGYYLWDPLAAVLALDESLGTFKGIHPDGDEAEGPQSGRTQLDPGGSRVRVAVGVDTDQVKTLFLDTLNGRGGHPPHSPQFDRQTLKFQRALRSSLRQSVIKWWPWLMGR